MPLEEVIRYLLADRGVKSEKDDWKAILEESEKTFHRSRRRAAERSVRVHFGYARHPISYG
jgi:hypothetical protein